MPSSPPSEQPSQVLFKPRKQRTKKRRRAITRIPSPPPTQQVPHRTTNPPQHSFQTNQPGSTPSPPARKRPSRWDEREQTNHYPKHTPTEPVEASTEPVEASTEPTLDDPSYLAYEQEQSRADREWYLGEYTHVLPDDEPTARRQSRRLTAAAAAAHADSARWEDRQLASGLYAEHTPHHHDLTDDAAPRITILVSELTPAFMNQHVSVTTSGNAVIGQDVVLPVKDPTSDMAVLARKGSDTVVQYRDIRERNRGRTKYWELGAAAGAKAKESQQVDAERAALAEGQMRDWKADAKYSAVMKGEKRTPEEIANVRRSLPVYLVKKRLMNIIREHQVCVIIGETGSGKTTQLTQYLEEDGYARYGMIGCTQPRRVAAVSVAQRVAEEFRGGVELGAEVGYTIRFEDSTSDKTIIKYMTDGILLRESLSDSELDRYTVIVMDEAHERSLNTDVLFGLLRGIIAKRRDLKVIVTSATLNAERFSDFFGGAPIFNIPGRTFPVDTFFSRTPVEDYVDGAVWQAVQLHIQAPLPGDILIFMTGQEDIETTCEALADKISKLENPRPILILPIYSQLPADLQAKIFQPAPEGTRKVVVATNIAETSLTIDGIRYVVDSGYCKLKTYNPRLGMDALLLCPASQSSVNQRSGRAGRTGPGKCYRLFTSSAYVTELLETNVPEIQRTNLSHVVLLLKTLGVQDLLEFPFLDAPPAENIVKSMLGLWLLGALNTDGNLTELGRKMSVFPLDPALSNLLFMGEQNGCLLETVTIVAMLSVPNVFVRPHGREEESDSAREKFFVPESDHLTLLHVYQRWRAAGCRADWCAKHYINSKSMRKAREVREQLLEIVKTQGMNESSCDEWDSIRRAIGFAFYYQAARRKGIGEYINIRSGVVCGLHPTSAMYGTGLSPDYVVYHELIMTKKEFMSCVTSVEPQWLAEAGPKLYIMKQAGDEGLKMAQQLQQKRAQIELEMRSSTSAAVS